MASTRRPEITSTSSPRSLFTRSQVARSSGDTMILAPKAVPPLICLPGTAGTADVCYKQIMSLSMKGYRVISVDIPCVWNHHEWILAFEKFLDAIDVHHIHIYGTALGGFLAQLFAQHRPRRVWSLILSNTFLDTRNFSAAMPWAPVISWTPSFLLKRYVLTGILDGPHEPFIADSVNFVVSQVEMLSREDLASRLTLTADAASVGTLLLTDSFITVMDTNDYSRIPQQLKDEVSERSLNARRAQLKTGGDFPFLSRPDEVNLHLQFQVFQREVVVVVLAKRVRKKTQKIHPMMIREAWIIYLQKLSYHLLQRVQNLIAQKTSSSAMQNSATSVMETRP